MQLHTSVQFAILTFIAHVHLKPKRCGARRLHGLITVSKGNEEMPIHLLVHVKDMQAHVSTPKVVVCRVFLMLIIYLLHNQYLNL